MKRKAISLSKPRLVAFRKKFIESHNVDSKAQEFAGIQSDEDSKPRLVFSIGNLIRMCGTQEEKVLYEDHRKINI